MNKQVSKFVLIFCSLLVVAIILFIFLNEEETKHPEEATPVAELYTKEEIDSWKEQVGVTYDEFSEEENALGDKATQLAEKYYIEKYGELRETSFFYAESLKDNVFVIVGMDKLDDRDKRFIELHVNHETEEVTEVSYTE